MLQVSSNKRYLVHEAGRPFFYLGDTAWELFYRLNREDTDFYLQDRAAKRFTVIQAVALSEFGELKQPNAYGDPPLHDQDPARPNERFFEHVDYVARRCAELGLHLGVLPTWADVVGPVQWGSNPERLNPENARLYGRFLGARYRDLPIIWILGGDRPVETDLQLQTWRALAAGLKEGDGGRHLMTYHPMGGHSSSDWVHNESWLDFNMIQTSHGARNGPTAERVARDYALSPTKPTMEAEWCYENHPVNWKPELGRFDDYDVRKGAYWSVFAGGHGFTYGCNDIFPFWEPGLGFYDRFHGCLFWKEALGLPGARQMQHLRALMESRPFLSRVPDQELLVDGEGSGAERVQATLDSSGSFALIYLPTGQPVTVDLQRLSGDRLKVSWFDPRTGAVENGGTAPRNRTARFEPPAAEDWVLVLDDAAAELPAPGSRA